MLSIVAPGWNRNCEGYTRREVLRIGTLGLGGLTLSGLLRTKAEASETGKFVRDKAVVVLNLQGGPTHIETFDPKMTAPAEYRAMFGEVKTCLPGVTFGSHFPQLAALADKLAIVRSYRHGMNSHGPAAMHVMAGGNPTEANMGSLYARVAGVSNSSSGIPNCAVIQPAAVGGISKGVDRVTSPGTLPDFYKPFDPSSGGQILENMQLRVPQDRLDDRRTLLASLDGLKRRLDGTVGASGADTFQQQAFDVIVGGVNQAFDLAREDRRLLERYDTSMFEIPQAAIARRKKHNDGKLVAGFTPVSLGKQLLLARRLVEAGCGFVTVTQAGWDMHGDHEFDISDGMPVLGPAVDKAVSAFIEDLVDRGLYDKVLLVITGEFGRTPKINNKRGRDHWGNLCTLAFAGGGLPMGQVIGASDRTASVPAGDVVTSGHLLATVMHTLFDIGELRLVGGIPTEIARALTEGTPIPQLYG